MEELVLAISEELNIREDMVWSLYEMSKAPIYADISPDIYLDESLIPLGEINGVAPNYVQWYETEYPHTLAYFLPDALYSLCSDISYEMQLLEEFDRGGEQKYFEALTDEARTYVLFNEAVLKYQNLSEYKDFLYEYRLSEGSEIFEYQVLPYEAGTSEVNDFMLAAACLVGNVRYIWGGGHTVMSTGISPRWEDFNLSYGDKSGCLVSSGGYCPEHGVVTDEEFHGDLIEGVLETPFYEHTLDGLDCSGFTSWIFTECTGTRHSALAKGFIGRSSIEEIDFNSELRPCDVFAWSKHIVMVVGSCGKGAYVTVECTPDILKYGVIYREGANITKALKVANEANKLIGGFTKDSAKAYCMDKVWKGLEDEYHAVGRSSLVDCESASAETVIQEVLVNLPRQFVLGYSEYDGEIFDKYVVRW